MRTALWLVISNVALSYHSFGEVSRVFEKFFVSSFCAAPSSPPAGTGISLKSVETHGIILLSTSNSGALSALQVVGLLSGVKSGGGLLFIFSGMFACQPHPTWTEESNMDVLNTVVNILHLIADVVIGVTQVTWMISKDVFRDKPKAKHYSKRNKK